jgi:hypothetical protein
MLIEVSKNVGQLSTRMDTIEMTLRTTSDRHSKDLQGISTTLRVLQDTMERRCAPTESHTSHSETGDNKDAASLVHPASTSRDAGATTNKDLLRRLKRGYLVQFEHDEPSDNASAPAPKERLFDIVKREVSTLCANSCLILQIPPVLPRRGHPMEDL